MFNLFPSLQSICGQGKSLNSYGIVSCNRFSALLYYKSSAHACSVSFSVILYLLLNAPAVIEFLLGNSALKLQPKKQKERNAEVHSVVHVKLKAIS